MVEAKAFAGAENITFLAFHSLPEGQNAKLAALSILVASRWAEAACGKVRGGIVATAAKA